MKEERETSLIFLERLYLCDAMVCDDHLSYGPYSRSKVLTLVVDARKRDRNLDDIVVVLLYDTWRLE